MLLTPIATCSSAGSNIRQRVRPAARVSRKINEKSLVFTLDPDSTAVAYNGNCDDNILSVE